MSEFAATRWATGILLCLAGLAFLLLVTFGSSRITRRHSVIDVAWGLGFAIVAVISFGWSSGHGDTGTRALLLGMTAVWGVRLGSYIGSRQRGAEEDPRYVDMLDRAAAKSPGASRTALAIRKIYLTQGLSILLISMPVQVGMYERHGPGVLAWVGVGLWVVGVFFEAVGDFQLARFKRNPVNKGTIMKRGLWAWTRHPNYFGDACVWWGIFLVAAGQWQGWLTIFAPIAMNALLARGTGKATLERHMGNRPGFSEYLNSTSGFFPLPPWVTRALNKTVAATRS